jgi:hypothetical protein
MTSDPFTPDPLLEQSESWQTIGTLAAVLLARVNAARARTKAAAERAAEEREP